MQRYIEVNELRFQDGGDGKLRLNIDLIYGMERLFPYPGTLIKMIGGNVHVNPDPNEIKQLIALAKQKGFARIEDLPRDPDDELFDPGPREHRLPGPTYVRKRPNSKSGNLTLNGVDVDYVMEQDALLRAMGAADALGVTLEDLPREMERLGIKNYF
jgi:hypothetical protein